MRKIYATGVSYEAVQALAGADAGHAVACALHADDVLYRRRRSLSAAMPTLGPNWRRCWCAAASSCRSSSAGVCCSTAVGRPGVTGIRILMAGRWEAGSHWYLDPDAALHRVSISDLLAPYLIKCRQFQVKAVDCLRTVSFVLQVLDWLLLHRFKL